MAAPVSRSDVWMDKKQSQCYGGLEAQAQAQPQCHGGLQALTGNLFNQMPHTDSSAPSSSSCASSVQGSF